MRQEVKVDHFEGIETYKVKHLPIVKAYADRLGLVKLINELVPSEMSLEPGFYFLGMVLDTLSGRNPLYRLEEFFEDQDTELLLGKKVDAKRFNDINVGRFIDQVFGVGAVKIFKVISVRAVSEFGLNCRHVHFDTTSRSVYGEYEPYGNDPFEITYGHSKDHRPDLKQFLISMLCVDRNVPVFGKIEDGNASDKSLNNDVLSEISKYMAVHGLGSGAFIYVADSAAVTKKNLEAMGKDILFISRLPANYKECGRVIKDAVSKDAWEDIGVIAETKPTQKRPAAYYKSYETEVTLYDESYRAVVIHSSAHDKRRQKRIERELAKEKKVITEKCNAVVRFEYFCREDAEAAANRLSKESCSYYEISTRVEEKPLYGRGRPRKDGFREVKEMRYLVSAKVSENQDAVSTFRKEAGCFVMLTNVPRETQEEEMGYDSKAILKTYKEQYGIEQDFGFLKDPVIVNSVFLKKPERIEVLGLILLTSLLIWRLMERSMRQYVEQTGEKLPGWKYKPTDRPTSFMMTIKFMGLAVIKIRNERRLSKPLNSDQKAFLLALGIKTSWLFKAKPG
jgi:transposase